MLWNLAFRNLMRNRRRTGLTLLAMSMACSLLMFTLSLNDGNLWSLILSATDQYQGHFRIQSELRESDPDLNHTISDSLPEVFKSPAVDYSPRLRGMFLMSSGTDQDMRSLPVEILGIDPDREQKITSLNQNLMAGKPLGKTQSGAILLGKELANKLRAEIGTEIIVMGQGAQGAIASGLFTVQGIFSSGDQMRDTRLSLIHLDDLQGLIGLPKQIHEWVGKTSDPLNIDPLVQNIRFMTPQFSVISWRDDMPQLATVVDHWFIVQIIVIVIFYSAVILIAANTMSMAILERNKELSILRALGLKRRFVLKLLLAEGFLLGIGAALFGAAIGGGLVAYFYLYPLDLTPWFGEINWGGLALRPAIRAWPQINTLMSPLILICALGVAATILPALNILHKRLYQALGER